MKIVHIYNGRCNPDSSNGVEKMISRLAPQQAALQHEVYILGVSSKPEIPIPGVTVQHHRPSACPWGLPQGLWSNIEAIAPDIVHLHSSYTPLNIRLAACLRSRNIPYVATPNGGCAPQILKRRPFIKLPYKALFERPFLNRAAFVHSVGDTTAIRQYGVTAPILEAPNGIDLQDIPPASGQAPLWKNRVTWEHKTILVFVGRLDPDHKGLDLLLAGAARAIHQGTQLGIILVGPDFNGKRKELETMAAQLEIANCVLFTGSSYGNDKFEWIRSGDIFVHTSRWEGMPLSVNEALACGKPCLVTPAANPFGLITKHGCGIEVQPEPESIARGLQELAGLPASQRQIMAAAARSLIERELRWENIAKKLVNAYQTYIPR